MQALNDARVETAIQSYFDALGRRDKKAWMSLLARRAILHEPVGTLPAEGEEGREQVWHMLTAPVSRLRIAPAKIFYGGSGAAVHWQAVATATSGSHTIEFEGISVFELDDEGLIQTVMSYWDPAEMLIRLADGDTQPDFD